MPRPSDQPQDTYFITNPVPGGHRYFDVRVQKGPHDLNGNPRLNFSLVTIYADMPGAESLARWALAMLKGQE